MTFLNKPKTFTLCIIEGKYFYFIKIYIITSCGNDRLMKMLKMLKKVFLIYFLYITACPAGYYGINCSDVCSTSYYGIGCTTKCECYPCHHIYGCMMITTVKQAIQMINTMKMEPTSKSNYQ